MPRLRVYHIMLPSFKEGQTRPAARAVADGAFCVRLAFSPEDTL
jgi:hypothetical protein